MEDKEVFQQLERLAAACPWDEVDIWISRQPQGLYSFTAYVKPNQDLGFDSVFGHGPGLVHCVDQAIALCKDRNPETQRKRKIAELEHQLFKLRNMQVGLPPYRAPNQLGYGQQRTVSPPANRVVDITSSRMEVQ